MVRLGEIIESSKTIAFLSRYSNTGKPFSSPDDSVFSEFENYLNSFYGVKVIDNVMLGTDIGVVCGMLNYEE